MLTVTDFAAAAIRHLLERRNAAAGSGLRLAQASGSRPLQAILAPAPAPRDTLVVAANGARVFLDEAAVSLLNGKILDVALGVGGRIEFFTVDAREPIEPGR